MAAKPDNRKLNSELKQNLFSNEERFEMFFSAHWKTLAVTAAAVAVLIAVAFGVHSAWRSARKKAAFELADAVTISQLEAAIANHPDESGTPAARYRLAKLNLDVKAYDKALLELDKIAVSDADQLLAGSARLTAAYIFELKGDAKNAAERFDAIGADGAVRPAVRAEADYSAGRLFAELGDMVRAKAAIGRLALFGEGRATNYYKGLGKQLDIAIDNHEFDLKPVAAPKPVAPKAAK